MTTKKTRKTDTYEFKADALKLTKRVGIAEVAGNSKSMNGNDSSLLLVHRH